MNMVLTGDQSARIKQNKERAMEIFKMKRKKTEQKRGKKRSWNSEEKTHATNSRRFDVNGYTDSLREKKEAIRKKLRERPKTVQPKELQPEEEELQPEVIRSILRPAFESGWEKEKKRAVKKAMEERRPVATCWATGKKQTTIRARTEQALKKILFKMPKQNQQDAQTILETKKPKKRRAYVPVSTYNVIVDPRRHCSEKGKSYSKTYLAVHNCGLFNVDEGERPGIRLYSIRFDKDKDNEGVSWKVGWSSSLLGNEAGIMCPRFIKATVLERKKDWLNPNLSKYVVDYKTYVRDRVSDSELRTPDCFTVRLDKVTKFREGECLTNKDDSLRANVLVDSTGYTVVVRVSKGRLLVNQAITNRRLTGNIAWVESIKWLKAGGGVLAQEKVSWAFLDREYNGATHTIIPHQIMHPRLAAAAADGVRRLNQEKEFQKIR